MFERVRKMQCVCERDSVYIGFGESLCMHVRERVKESILMQERTSDVRPFGI